MRKLAWTTATIGGCLMWIALITGVVWAINSVATRSQPQPTPTIDANVVIVQQTVTPWPIYTPGPTDPPYKLNIPPDPGHGPVPICKQGAPCPSVIRG